LIRACVMAIPPFPAHIAEPASMGKRPADTAAS
jgi:hypothetical protein